ERAGGIREQMKLGVGDACFFVAGDPLRFQRFAGLARDRVGEELNLIDENRYEFAWIVDFPFFEWNEDEKRVDFGHNPFSMPQGGSAALGAATTVEEQLQIRAYQYDLVCNGYELASGGIRNHRPDTMVKAFGIVGLSAEDVEK